MTLALNLTHTRWSLSKRVISLNLRGLKRKWNLTSWTNHMRLVSTWRISTIISIGVDSNQHTPGRSFAITCFKKLLFQPWLASYKPHGFSFQLLWSLVSGMLTHSLIWLQHTCLYSYSSWYLTVGWTNIFLWLDLNQTLKIQSLQS